LGLASQVSLERLVSCLLQHCKRGGVLVIADGGNPAVVGPVVRRGRKEGREVGNELPREGPCLCHRLSGCRCGNRGVDMLDRLLDKFRVGAGEFESAEALGGVKIVQDVQEELAVRHVVLLEVEQAA